VLLCENKFCQKLPHCQAILLEPFPCVQAPFYACCQPCEMQFRWTC
jgi:hypothetical protein